MEGEINQSPTTAAPDSTEVAVTLRDAVVISEVGDLRRHLLAVLEQAGPVVIDAGGVQRVDTVGLQLLQSFVHTLHGQGRSLSWKETPPAVSQGAQLLGLSASLRCG